ncbi:MULTISPECIES: hypothetical protein [Streptomyces]|uniref:Uncharacterized protein n=2 Tax=Streptomyces TaxID=1883 RepID=A0ABS9JA91_9ACTN|nr:MULTISPECIES: hypothetical protein [Streptomyces]CUW27393.1 hypothetical protein TUE45_02117 [Streptomyces reticuli]AKN70130.1 hypothetical protein QR97_10050 [Streptomyces sp. PBH53]MCE0445002.1 hypothetical protein [Streptomyces tricolor]MCG0062475.1 hypothetical protein [Streptomyces tricolor]OYP18543.1 hypothetical protein CFC35_31960 [Streptomyces sp. FBKL.4005]
MGGVRTEKAVERGDGEEAGGTRPARRRPTMSFDAIAGLADRLADEWAARLGLPAAHLGLPAEQLPNG